MKKIINGKIYDTDTAKEIGSQDNGLYTNDLYYVCETLYKKKTGEFFLLGEGGAGTNYSKRCGSNNWCGSSTIIPMSFEEAQKWAEKHLSADEYQQIFGEISEDESKVALNLSLSAAIVEKAKRAAAQSGMTVSAFIESKLSDL